MTHLALRTAVSISALILATQANAQEVLDLGTITVSAGLESVEPEATGVVVDVITEDEIQTTGAVRVTDILARQPGVTVRSTGGLAGTSTVFLRGVGSNNIAVRVDGIDVADPSGTQVAFDFGGLGTAGISQIDVIRGSQSALFGSEAIGGAIAITSKRPTRDGLSYAFDLEYGSDQTVRSAASLMNRGVGHETAVTLSYTRSDGFSAADENERNPSRLAPGARNTEDDAFEARRINVFGRYDLGETVTLEIAGFAEDAEYDYDETSSGRVYDGTPDDVTERTQRGLRASLEFATGVVDNTVSLSWFEIDRRLSGTTVDLGAAPVPVPPYAGTPYPFDFSYDGTRRTARYQGGVDLGATARLVFGLEKTEETYTDDGAGASAFGPYTFGQSHETDITSAFAELTWSPTSDIDLSFALRQDEHSEFGGFTTGRVSGAWRIRPDVTLRANLANGFRAPSNYELYAPFSGNADLEPETSTSLDIGVEKRWDVDTFLRATAFWVEAEDIIDYSFTTFAYAQAPGTSTRRGIELAGGARLSDRMVLDAAYTWTDSFGSAAIDSASWAQAVPRHSLSATLTTEVTDRMDLSLTGLFEADRPDGLEDYGLMNASMGYDVTDTLRGYVRVENLFDTEYQSVTGYGQSDRAIFVGLNASF